MRPMASPGLFTPGLHSICGNGGGANNNTANSNNNANNSNNNATNNNNNNNNSNHNNNNNINSSSKNSKIGSVFSWAQNQVHTGQAASGNPVNSSNGNNNGAIAFGFLPSVEDMPDSGNQNK
jgi:hypothetical protein